MTIVPPLFEARPSRQRLLLLLIGAAFLIAGSVFILLGPDRLPRFRNVAWAAALIGLPLFSLGAVIVLRMMMSDAVQIRIDGRGIYWKRWSEAPIPFGAIERASVGTIRGNSFLCLHLKDPARYASDSALMRATAGANKKMGFGDVAIGTTGLDRSFEELHAAYQEWSRTARSWAA